MRKIILAVSALLLLAGAIDAAPLQKLGGLRTPDAYLIPHLTVEGSLAGYYRHVERPSYVDPGKNGLNFYGMVGVGLFNWVQLDAFAGDYVYFLNAKAKILPESQYVPQIAVGLDNILSPVNRRRSQDYRPYWDPEIGDDGAPSVVYDPHDLGWIDHPDKTDYEYYSPYVVLSKRFGRVVEFNLGLGFNNYTGQVARSRWFSGAFSSIEIKPVSNISIMGEYDGKDINAGLKYSYQNLEARLGAQAIEDLAKGSEGNGYENNLRLALGVSYKLDFTYGRDTWHIH
ncbi:MAG: hypothetical protein PHD87_00765 [Candidatus Cloacimonetes bacterium]|nr:hypothetical protein [Candidatus Cloacimonadota bacterium]MDD3143014.1 hypothetical protein [Candidatus Cloacimonadota bacterium]MDD4223105.1 hypothetical protein [Candidatus Cloacimonadota bacterium]